MPKTCTEQFEAMDVEVAILLAAGLKFPITPVEHEGKQYLAVDQDFVSIYYFYE